MEASNLADFPGGSSIDGVARYVSFAQIIFLNLLLAVRSCATLMV